MADSSLHRQGVALYKALAKLTPSGADRLEMNLHDIVTKGGASRAFTADGQLNENAIKQAWRYLASIGAVENLGPRFKRALKDPDEAAASSGSATTAAATTTKRAAKKTAKRSTKRAAKRTTKRASKKRAGTRQATGARKA